MHLIELFVLRDPYFYRLALFSREVDVVDGFKTGVLDMRIDLGGGDAGMTQRDCGQII